MRELADGVRVLEPQDYRRMRWKNGQGWTTEIAVSPPDAGLNGKPFDWRISMAEIEQDGDFSAFTGYDRTILVAHGAGLELTFDAAPPARLAERYRPVGFKGEWRTRCHLLDGPVRDFNVMTMRSRWQHQCHVVQGTGVKLRDEPTAAALVVHALRGAAEIRNGVALQFRLQSQETFACSSADVTHHLDLSSVSTDTVLAIISLKRAAPV
ncbi:MAG: HutD/Ves family protein [Gammaproteobacteria bacterium]